MSYLFLLKQVHVFFCFKREYMTDIGTKIRPNICFPYILYIRRLCIQQTRWIQHYKWIIVNKKQTRTCFKRNKCDMFYIDLHDYIYDICNINETVGLFMSIYGINCATKYINRDVINMVNICMNMWEANWFVPISWDLIVNNEWTIMPKFRHSYNHLLQMAKSLLPVWHKTLPRILVPISVMYSLLKQKKHELVSKETNMTYSTLTCMIIFMIFVT
jgi:hypothetical protein